MNAYAKSALLVVVVLVLPTVLFAGIYSLSKTVPVACREQADAFSIKREQIRKAGEAAADLTIEKNWIKPNLQPPLQCDDQLITLVAVRRYEASSDSYTLYDESRDKLVLEAIEKSGPYEHGGDPRFGLTPIIDQLAAAPYAVIQDSASLAEKAFTPAQVRAIFDLRTNELVGQYYYLGERDTSEADQAALEQLTGGSFDLSKTKLSQKGVNAALTTMLPYILYIITAGIGVLIAIPMIITGEKEQRQIEEIRARGAYPEFITCPCCSKSSSNIKRASVPTFVLFLGFIGAVRNEVVTACPECLRSAIRRSYLINLLPGNFVMLLLTPVYFAKVCLSYRSGHSRKVVIEKLAQPAGSSPRTYPRSAALVR